MRVAILSRDVTCLGSNLRRILGNLWKNPEKKKEKKASVSSDVPGEVSSKMNLLPY